MAASRKRKAEADQVVMIVNNNNNEEMVELLNQFDKEAQQMGLVAETASSNGDIQQILTNIEQNMNIIRSCLEPKKEQKNKPSDINRKLDTILVILNQNGYGYVLASTNEQN